METVLQFNINSGRGTNYAYVHITNSGAKVCVHFPRLKLGERMERFDSYQEAESYAMKINAERLNVNLDNLVLATVDTSTYPIDDDKTVGVMTGCFMIKDSLGNILEKVIYEPEDRFIKREKNFNLSDVAEIKTAIYMLNYLREKEYSNVVINYDNVKIAATLKGNINVYSKSEQMLINELRKASNRMSGILLYQHMKSHTGHKNLDYVDRLAKKENKKVFTQYKKGLLQN